MDRFVSVLGYKFKNFEYLEVALTHFSSENPKKSDMSQLLEHLGDAALNLVMTDVLFHNTSNPTEEKLTKLRSSMVNNENLAKTCEILGIADLIKINPHQKLTKSILAKVFESIIGAVYLDGGFASAFVVVEKIYFTYWSKITEDEDYKSQLQKKLQQKYHQIPQYKLLSKEGLHHEPFFRVIVSLGDKILAQGEGFTKKAAEQEAAHRALKEC